MRARLIAAACGVALMGAGPPPSPGYLGAQVPDTLKILPPAPVAGTTRYEADRTVFLETRRFKGSKRWEMAAADDSSVLIMKHLSCAVGVELTAKNAPTLAGMIPKVGRDSSTATNYAKDALKRKRPFYIDEGPICLDPGPTSYDYPSGHNTFGWTVGLILAELAPDRATEILLRARAFGESRLVCGVHSLSAVEAGRTNGSIVVAALHGQPAFRADMEKARTEVAAARKAGPAPDGAACAAEAELIAKSPY